MSINAVSSSSNLQLNPFNRLDGGTVNPASNSADGTAATSAQKPEDNGFFDAVSSALSSIGVTIPDGSSTGASSTDGSTSTSATAGSSDAGQALGAFLHQLMGTLHAQGGGQAQGEGGEGKVAGAGGHHHGGGHGGMGHIESDLQSLVQKLSSGSSDSSSTDGSASTTDTSSDSSVSGLQSSFANLLTSLGASSDGSNAKLSSFLQSLSGSLEGATSLPTSGNLVNTKA